MERTTHPEVTLTVHLRRWVLDLPDVPGSRPVDPPALPVVPLPAARRDRQTRPEQQIQPVSRTASVPSRTPHDDHSDQSKRSIVPAQQASDPNLASVSVSLEATVRGSSPWRRTPHQPKSGRFRAELSRFAKRMGETSYVRIQISPTRARSTGARSWPWEIRDQAIGMLASGPMSVQQALRWPPWRSSRTAWWACGHATARWSAVAPW